MRTACWILAALSTGLAGCGSPQDPKLALPTARATSEVALPAPSPALQRRYSGRTAEQWAQALEDPDPRVVTRASMALRILGAEGRPHLIRGLESPSPETRRICLETLSVSDLRAYGDEGKRLLIKLAGDPMDLRIRERAQSYLLQWNQALPAR